MLLAFRWHKQSLVGIIGFFKRRFVEPLNKNVKASKKRYFFNSVALLSVVQYKRNTMHEQIKFVINPVSCKLQIKGNRTR